MRRLPLGRVVIVLGLVAAAVLVARGLPSSGGTAAPGATGAFDPSSPCTADVRQPGAYPELEKLVPVSLFGSAPANLDSGRNCTPKNLGTLATHGISEVRFAGGRWERSSTSGVTLAVFSADGLTAEWLGEWYEASARAAAKTAGLAPTRPMIDGVQAYRLDLLSSDVEQSVIVWPAAQAGTVNVVIAAGVPEADIEAGIAAFP